MEKNKKLSKYRLINLTNEEIKEFEAEKVIFLWKNPDFEKEMEDDETLDPREYFIETL